MRATIAEELRCFRQRVIFRSKPIVVCLDYGIHCNKPLATDTALVMGWHLCAGTSPSVTALLYDIVIVINPCLSPDGHEHIYTQLMQMLDYVTNMEHVF